MNTADVLDVIGQLDRTDTDVLDRDELAAAVAASARVRSWLDAFDLRCSRRARTLSEAGQAETAASLLANHGNRTDREAEQITDRDRIGGSMPSFEEGLAEGEVSAGHLDAIAAATRNASPEVREAFASHEAELLEVARHERIVPFRRRCHALVALLTAQLAPDDQSDLDRLRAASRIRRWVSPDGLHHTEIMLDPLRDEVFWTAINRSLRRLQQREGNARTPWNQLQIEALLHAVSGGVVGRADADAGAGPGADAGSVAGGGVAGDPSPVGDIASDLAAAVDVATARHASGRRSADRSSPVPNDGHDAAQDEELLPDLADEPAPAHGPGPSGGLAAAGGAAADDDSGHAPGAADGCRCGRADDEVRSIEQRVPEVSVLTDLATLVGGLHDQSICETENGRPLPVSTIRRLCCDAEIVPIVMNGDGEVLDVGRSRRTVTRPQRRALRAMHRTCAHPDCSVPFVDTKIHHIRWWWRHTGRTDVDNLIPLCERCHHLVHEGGWGLTMTPDRIATWTRPDGTVHHEGSCIDRRPGTDAWLTGRRSAGDEADRRSSA